jgi:EH domain-containing protein 1
VFRSVLKRHNLAPGDFPEIKDFRSKLEEQDFSKFAVLKPQLIETADSALSIDIPRLMEALPRSVDPTTDVQLITPTFDADVKASGELNPFGSDDPEASGWCLDEFVPEYQPLFDQRNTNGFITGGVAKEILTSSGIDVPSLRKIWDLSDIDKDGQLDFEEFVIAMFLTSRVKAGDEIPGTLDPEMVPLSKRS